MKKVQTSANNWSFILTLVCGALITIWAATIETYSSDWGLALLPMCAVTFLIGVFGIPFETWDKKQLIRSVISLFVSLVMCLYLLYALIAPFFFPFGIPPF